VVDASPHGVGAILTQIQPTKDDRRDVQIVAYASRALDDVESRYSQTERGALAVYSGHRPQSISQHILKCCH